MCCVLFRLPFFSFLSFHDGFGLFLKTVFIRPLDLKERERDDHHHHKAHTHTYFATNPFRTKDDDGEGGLVFVGVGVRIVVVVFCRLPSTPLQLGLHGTDHGDDLSQWG